MKRCMGCMREYSKNNTKCPVCGYSDADLKADMDEMPDALKSETILAERFILGRVLSYTDFSIIYVAWDALLQRRVAIKEYLPMGLGFRDAGTSQVQFRSQQEEALFEKGRSYFEKEAERLNRNQDIDGIIKVYKCFQANNTSYIMMEYLEGLTLQDFYNERMDFPGIKIPDLFRNIVKIVLDMNDKGIYHYNLSPDNIYLDFAGNVTLLDFGDAKRKIHQLTSNSRHLFREGFTAPEVLSEGKASKSADLYSAGTIYYYLLTYKEPPVSTKRKKNSVLKTGNEKGDKIVNDFAAVLPEKRLDGTAQAN